MTTKSPKDELLNGMDYEVFVRNEKGIYAYPYISRIVGEHPLYLFRRKFLERVQPYWHDGGRCYLFPIIAPGIYEVGIKRRKKDTKELVSREVKYFIYDGDCSITNVSPEDVFNMVYF